MAAALSAAKFSMMFGNQRQHFFNIHRLTKYLVGVDCLAVRYFTIAVHLAQLTFRIQNILALYVDALDFLSIPCLHGEIKFQHNFPKKLPCRKLTLQTGFSHSAKFSHLESMDQMQSIKV